MSEQVERIRLTNAVTGEKHEFSFINYTSPSLINKIDERDTLVKRFQKLTEGEADDDKAVQHLLTKTTRMGIEILSMMLEPVHPSPEHDNKYELIKDCVVNGAVVSQVIGFFFDRLSVLTSEASASIPTGLEVVKSDSDTSP